jgi:hypothetical protein
MRGGSFSFVSYWFGESCVFEELEHVMFCEFGNEKLESEFFFL